MPTEGHHSLVRSWRAWGFVLLFLGTFVSSARAHTEGRGDGVYADLDAVAGELAGWVLAPPEGVLVQSLDLGVTSEGRAVPAVVIGAIGPLPLEDRATVFLIGALDGVSLAGGEGVLQVARRMLGDPKRLRNDQAFLVVPWGAPDALTRTMAEGASTGTGPRSGDADGDGAEMEDAPDDLDGDGFVLEMLIEDPLGPWTLPSDGRIPIQATADSAMRYRRVREGRDDDGDGLYNEDAGLGSRLDANFPIGWETVPRELRGLHPLSEPTARALASEILARRTALVLVVQGDHGGLAFPGGTAELAVDPRDVGAFTRTLGAFRTNMNRPWAEALPLARTGAGPRGGTLVDWCYAVPGIPALEVAVWGPHAGCPPEAESRVALSSRSEDPSLKSQGGTSPWSPWLDRECGGMGFVEWRPVDLGPGIHARVGGWEPLTRFNPPANQLPRALQGLDGFVRAMADGLPRLECIITLAEREGSVVRLSATLRTRGLWPTSLAAQGLWPGAQVGTTRLDLDLPAGARLLGGAESVDLGALPGGATSREVEWLILLPQGASMTLRGHAPFVADAVREVRP
tara:strand:+ start:9220 stop:10932 length:1713 start_codon:yes stop_codon:yes gene_type:complete